MTETIGDILPNAARRFGVRTAMIVEGRSFTFNELDQLSNRIANGLVASGVRPGDRVTLFGHNCWEWIVAYYGIVKTGAVVNPINVMLTPEEVRFVVEDSGARAVIASQDKGGSLAGHERQQLRRSCYGATSRPPARFVRRLAARAESPTFDIVPRNHRPISAQSATPPGTTGFPKGADAKPPLRDLRHRRHDTDGGAEHERPHGKRAAMPACLWLMRVQRRDHVRRDLHHGAALRGSGDAAAISEHRATIMDGVPTAYYYLLAHPDFEKLRPVQPDAVLDRRPDAAGGQVH